MLARIRKAKDEGFTLIELLIVIIVLGILAAIVVFAVGSTRKDSVASSCKTNLKSIELSAEAVNTKVGAYPTGVVNSKSDSDAGTAGVQNPLLAASITPDNGALLKVWPSDGDYILQWKGTAVQVFPKTFSVNSSGVVMNDAATPIPATDAMALSCTTL